MAEQNREKPTTSPRVRIVSAGPKYDAERQELKRQSLSLIEETNKTFKELTSTLNKEQNRLSELEERRKTLLAEMEDLKAEIEREKEACRRDLEETNHEETDSVDSWYGLNEEEMEKKARLSSVIQETDLPKQPEVDVNAKKRRTSVDIANDLVNRLEALEKRASSSVQKP